MHRVHDRLPLGPTGSEHDLTLSAGTLTFEHGATEKNLSARYYRLGGVTHVQVFVLVFSGFFQVLGRVSARVWAREGCVWEDGIVHYSTIHTPANIVLQLSTRPALNQS
jgi:hypothetical protein